MLYSRTVISLVISLFTSRVTLELLGVDNFGINSAVAGVIAMFSVVSGSLSGAISRFITYELGHGDAAKLKRIFSTALNIQLLIGVVILLLGETVGVWFLNTHMNIPDGRMVAANWVLQCAMFSFFIGLTQTPYTACIIGHERMSVYAWFSIAETVLRLVIVYMLYIIPYDKLITLSVLGLMVSILLRVLQRVYCAHHFEECHYSIVLDKGLLKEMTGFAGWT
ncbi:MAG: lipopolysaccharide biosynthesis protein, partial [Muribaculaceae bacterium]|nr:lipopolysaccharide biosynthesis protein [Muribaculaceae bacterium]